MVNIKEEKVQRLMEKQNVLLTIEYDGTRLCRLAEAACKTNRSRGAGMGTVHAVLHGDTH